MTYFGCCDLLKATIQSNLPKVLGLFHWLFISVGDLVEWGNAKSQISHSFPVSFTYFHLALHCSFPYELY